MVREETDLSYITVCVCACVLTVQRVNCGHVDPPVPQTQQVLITQVLPSEGTSTVTGEICLSINSKVLHVVTV